MTAPPPWLAPYRATPIDGAVLIPGSKSLTNRALILAALADGPSVLSRPLGSRDTDLMVGALIALGASVERDGTEWTVTPSSFANRAPADIDCGLAGNVMRFVPPVAALSPATVSFDGDKHARVRPMSGIIEALRALGAKIDDDGRGALPFALRGRGGLRGGEVEIDASASSQFVSALLLAGARYEQGIDIRHSGSPLPSMPHILMTVAQLRLRGVDVDDFLPDRWVVKPGPIAALDQEIEPDLSNAGPFIAGALVTQGAVRIRNWPAETDQPGDQWQDIARAFGATVESDASDMVFTAGDTLHGVDLDLHDVGELTPVIAAVAALADGPSRLTGIAHLRGHETDRLSALATEINRLGGKVAELDDGLEIVPAPLHGGTFRTYDDHRMAHTGVVLGLRIPDLLIENVATTVKTYPNFAPDWERFIT
ncbi:MAG TPA: 3-phosphoshikimate 1-carboxyvinyltransferase [Aeromicrobium sp.]|nr:3-phosphoshikimate 1-carboxyvinyltransferase [Aeromicrobium sp.]